MLRSSKISLKLAANYRHFRNTAYVYIYNGRRTETVPNSIIPLSFSGIPERRNVNREGNNERIIMTLLSYVSVVRRHNDLANENLSRPDSATCSRKRWRKQKKRPSYLIVTGKPSSFDKPNFFFPLYVRTNLFR